MTREEAIAIIRKEYLCVDRDCDIERSCGKCDLMMPNKEPILQAYKLAIKALEQEPKTGRWILTDDDCVYCSECEDSYYPRPIDASWYYCPHCGAKMVEPQESEDDVLNKIKGYVDHIRNTGMGKKKSLEFIEKFIEGLKAESEEE